jgi:hypothetical protein
VTPDDLEVGDDGLGDGAGFAKRCSELSFLTDRVKNCLPYSHLLVVVIDANILDSTHPWDQNSESCVARASL